MNRIIDKGTSFITQDGEKWTCCDRSYSEASAIFTNGVDIDVVFYDRTVSIDADGTVDPCEPIGMPIHATRRFSPTLIQNDLFAKIIKILREERNSYD